VIQIIFYVVVCKIVRADINISINWCHAHCYYI